MIRAWLVSAWEECAAAIRRRVILDCIPVAIAEHRRVELVADEELARARDVLSYAARILGWLVVVAYLVSTHR